MLISEISIAVLIGLLVVVGAIYLTYFSYTTYKKNKNRSENGDEIDEKSKKSKALTIALLVYFACSLFIFTTNVIYRFSPAISEKHYVSIKTDSMSQALSSNTYLKEHNLANQIAQYDIAVFKETKKEDIALYDIILFKNDNRLIAHRIVEINEDGKYITQGDKNKERDDFVTDYTDVVGKYSHSLVFMSFINYLGYTPGLYVGLVGVTYAIGVVLFFDYKNSQLIKEKATN